MHYIFWPETTTVVVQGLSLAKGTQPWRESRLKSVHF